MSIDQAVKRLAEALRAYEQNDMEGITCSVSRQACEEGAAMILDLAAQLEAARKDAERWRYYRSLHGVNVPNPFWHINGTPEDVDARADTAMRADRLDEGKEKA